MARQVLSEPEEFQRTARYWTENFALRRRALDDKVQQLVDMGFPADSARAALQRAGGDENAAMEALLA